MRFETRVGHTGSYTNADSESHFSTAHTMQKK